jgi:serine/threonine protein phosphatase PrpC
MIDAFGVSDIGPVRENNEDCLGWDLGLKLFVVADGMGGEAAGEVASSIALDTIVEFVQQTEAGDDFTWPFGLDPTLSDGANRLRTALLLANHRILSLAGTTDEYLGMGTTAVCALLNGARLTIAHVGDSRLYLFANGTLTLMTEDDSLAVPIAASDGGDQVHQAAVAAGYSRHVLTNVLGARPDTEIHIAELELADGTLILLCSDGLHGAVADTTLRDVLGRDDDLQNLSRALIATALEQGTRDNVTALLIRYSPDS